MQLAFLTTGLKYRCFREHELVTVSRRVLGGSTHSSLVDIEDLRSKLFLHLSQSPEADVRQRPYCALTLYIVEDATISSFLPQLMIYHRCKTFLSWLHVLRFFIGDNEKLLNAWKVLGNLKYFVYILSVEFKVPRAAVDLRLMAERQREGLDGSLYDWRVSKSVIPVIFRPNLREQDSSRRSGGVGWKWKISFE
jgi:hypothetical protein